MRKFFVLASAVLSLSARPGLAQTQTREITGKVTVSGTSAPLQDAIVGLVGSAGGARTNERGEFRLRAPEGDVTVQARAIGYKRGSVRLTAGQNSTDFALERDVLQIEGVTVTGAATTIERRNAATAVASVNSEQLTRVPAASVENAMQGKVIGASINMNNGAPGGGGQIQIRGASSLIGNIQPLFVIDGVIISNAVRSNRLAVVTGSLNSGEENGTNRLADINPNDIENIEILKGGAASAIYGSQATNGVVIITTKRGSNSAPTFNITQKVGTYSLLKKMGSRHFTSADQVIAATGGGADATAAANAACTPTCPYFDYQGELYGQTDPSYETLATLSGGVGSTRYFVSGAHREDKGIAINTGAKRQSLRANVDQSIGNRWTVSLGSNILRSFSQRGVGNNDNALSSPIYAFGYAPAIVDLKKRDALGNWPDNPFPAIRNTSNPFQTFNLMQNNEDVFRMIFSGRANFAAITTDKNTLNFSINGGADRFSNENYIIAPPTLQFQRPGTVQGTTFPGTVIQGNGTNLFTNVTTSGVWGFSGIKGLNFTTAAGVQYEKRGTNDYNIVGRGLTPNQRDAAGAANTTVTNARQAIVNQALFAQEEILAFDERLYLSGAVRGERSSVNGDRDKVFYFPGAKASYRLVSPFRGVNELKLRASYGQSGNQAQYGERDVVLFSNGIYDSQNGFSFPTTVGNPNIEPERMTEVEGGIDGSLFNDRIFLEATYYKRNISNLLVRPQLATSTGITSTTRNGGKMETNGYEVGLTIVPIQTRNFSWSSRNTWFQNSQIITEFPVGVRPFTVSSIGGFGAAYGRLRFAPGNSVSTIWGNQVVDGATRVDVPLGDANPKYQMSFSNDFRWRSFGANVLIDYRHGGTVSNMTKNLFDEGGNTWDYDEPSPEAGVPLGEYRYNLWGGGTNTGVYLEDGSFTKVREVNISYDLPRSWASKIPGAKTGRLNLSGRNLFMITNYNGFDPEVNNGGNFVVRFVDLAPFPTSRSFFFSVDLGF